MTDRLKIAAWLFPPHDNYVKPPDGAEDNIVVGASWVDVRCAHFMLKTPIPAKPLDEERGW